MKIFNLHMKRIYHIIAAVLVTVLMSSCKEDLTPTANFTETLVNLHPSQSVDLSVKLDRPAETALSIPVEFACESNAYSVSDKAFKFAQGSNTASITLTDIDLPAGTTVSAKLVASAQAYVGVNYSCFVVKDESEAYSIQLSSSAIELSSCGRVTLSISLTGAYSGNKFKAPEDKSIPFSISGDNASLVSVQDGLTQFTVPKGKNSASVVLLCAETLEEGSAVVSLGGEAAGKQVAISIKSFSPASLIGEWAFSRVYDAEEIMVWFEDEGDDSDLLPLNNEGFTLTFTEGEDGKVTLTPGEGDFANFFRVSEVSLTAPVNISSKGKIVGPYQCSELNMFQAEDPGLKEPVVYTYFKLSPANRAFSASTESAGDGVVAFRINDEGNLEMMFRDYDQPPFGENWWLGFDPDMFGFCSLFTRVE